MQSGRQYGLSEIEQFVLARNSAPPLFAQSQDAVHSPNPFPQQQYSFMQHQQQHLDRYHAYPYQQTQNHLHQHPRPPCLQLQSHTHQQPQPPLLSFPHPAQQKTYECPQEPQAVRQISLHSGASDMVCPVAPRPSSSQSRLVVRAKESSGDDDGAEDEKRSHGCHCWTNEETIALLRTRSELDKDFRDSTLKTQLWEEISRKLAMLGFNRSAKKCKEIFKNAHKDYKKMKGGKGEGEDGNAFYAPHENNDSGGSIGDTTQAAGRHMRTRRHGGNACPRKSDGKPDAAETSLIEVPETSSGLTLSSDSFNQDGSYERQRNDEQECKKKRKRRSWSSAKVFFEKLAKQLLEQQQTLHTRFLETIERREYESILRQETFRKQELARLNREQELRAQERVLAATRNAALVTFLQNLTGQTLQLPTNPTESFVSDTHDDTERDTSDMNTSRWPKVEVHALIRLRSGLEPRFQEAGPKAQLWEEISASMACMGYSRSAKRCKEKWENINKYFRKMKDSCRKRPDNAKTCPYFHHLETLYQKGVLCAPSSKYNKLENQYENLHENTTDRVEENQGGNAEMLINFPSTENTSQLASIKSISSQFCRNYEDATADDHGLQKAKLNYVLPDCVGNGFVPSDLDVEVCRHGQASLSSKEILELQQEQHQKLLEEYEKLERTEEGGQKQNDHLGQERPQPNSQDNAELMSLVRKLADDSSQFRILAANKS